MHSAFKPPEQPDIILPVEIEDRTCYVYVLIRPNALRFLQELKEYYEIVIFTASLSKYAEPLMKQLDPEGICETLLFRDHCTYHNNVFVKDLS